MKECKAKEEQTLNSVNGSRNELQYSINSFDESESETSVASGPPQMMKIQLQSHKGLFIWENQTQVSLNWQITFTRKHIYQLRNLTQVFVQVMISFSPNELVDCSADISAYYAYKLLHSYFEDDRKSHQSYERG
jgi:hypothetical protein